MALTTYEIFDNVGELIKRIGEAVKEDSTGGQKISLSEVVSIITATLTKLGVDIADED